MFWSTDLAFFSFNYDRDSAKRGAARSVFQRAHQVHFFFSCLFSDQGLDPIWYLQVAVKTNSNYLICASVSFIDTDGLLITTSYCSFL